MKSSGSESERLLIMQPTAVLLECSELTDNDLEALKSFLEGNEAVDGVTVGYLAMFEESEPSALIEIHAAASPLILTVHLLKDHWAAITGGVTTTVKTVSWVKKRIKAFNKARNAKYDFKPLYDADGNVYKLIKVLKA